MAKTKFEKKPDRLWIAPNQNKEKDNHPDYKGDITISKETYEAAEPDEKGMVTLRVAAWLTDFKGDREGTYLAGNIDSDFTAEQKAQWKEKKEKEENTSAAAEDLPF